MYYAGAPERVPPKPVLRALPCITVDNHIYSSLQQHAPKAAPSHGTPESPLFTGTADCKGPQQPKSLYYREVSIARTTQPSLSRVIRIMTGNPLARVSEFPHVPPLPHPASSVAVYPCTSSPDEVEPGFPRLYLVKERRMYGGPRPSSPNTRAGRTTSAVLWARSSPLYLRHRCNSDSTDPLSTTYLRATSIMSDPCASYISNPRQMEETLVGSLGRFVRMYQLLNSGPRPKF